jgi:hypothetical protein
MNRRRGRLTDAFVDESVRGQRYLMGCALLAARDLHDVRLAVTGLATRRNRVHFHNELAARRREILISFAGIPITALVVICQRTHGVSEHIARDACLSRIVTELQDLRVSRLVIESRQVDRDDERTIVRTRRPAPTLIFEHRSGPDEPLLWIADGITWAVGVGGDWTSLVQPILGRIIEIRP